MGKADGIKEGIMDIIIISNMINNMIKINNNIMIKIIIKNNIIIMIIRINLNQIDRKKRNDQIIERKRKIQIPNKMIMEHNNNNLNIKRKRNKKIFLLISMNKKRM